MGTLMMKFGGNSVATTTALTQVISIVLQEYERWDRLVIVASALEGVTDSLIEAAHLAQMNNQRGYRRIVATIRTRHLALVDQLPLSHDERNALTADIDKLLFDMMDVCQSLADTPTDDNIPTDKIDLIIGVGERLSARIIAALLRENNLRGVSIDATTLFITDDTFGHATPDLRATRERVERDLTPLLDRGIIPVVTGFIGSTPDGRATTVGRGGSDYTASILSVCVGADELWIWTHVDGLMSADPREMPNARVIPSMSYHEVAELAYFGARILHSRMVKPLKEHNIPLRVKNVLRPQQAGTVIHHHTENQSDKVKAVTSIYGLGLRADGTISLKRIMALVNQVFEDIIGSKADVMISSQSSNATFLCFVVPTSANLDALRLLQNALRYELDSDETMQNWDVFPVGVITAIASQIDQKPRLVGRVIGALDDITILAMAQGPSHSSISLVVERDQAELALERIHRLTHP
jgi:aspartokinase/homoserine dehydrogenase 1